MGQDTRNSHGDTVFRANGSSRSVPGPTAPLRVKLLETAAALTGGPRNATYGPPVANMERTASIFNALTGRDLSAYEAAMFMVALKLARLPVSPNKADHYADCMAYLGMAAECVEAETGMPVE